MIPRRIRRSWQPAVGLFGPRKPYAAGRIDESYRILRASELLPPPWSSPALRTLLLANPPKRRTGEGDGVVAADPSAPSPHLYPDHVGFFPASYRDVLPIRGRGSARRSTSRTIYVERDCD